MEQHSVVGKSFPRVQARELATGRAKFSVDIKVPGMLHGKILRSPYPHAKILNIETAQAERLPGIKAIITAKDMPELAKTIPSIAEPPLAIDKVRYIGEAVAGVAAIDADVAEKALSLIKVEYEELPAVFDPEESIKPESPRIHDTERNIATRFEIARGDVDEGFAQADFIAEERFVCPPQAHCTMEPKSCIASFDASGKLNMYSTSAMIFETRLLLAKSLNLPEHLVRMIQPQSIGGHFGSCITIPLYHLCSFLARKADLPVKLANTREEEFATIHPPLPLIIELKMGVKRDGMIVAKQTKVIGDAGAYFIPIALSVLNVAAMRHESLYRFNNIKTEASLIFTNKIPSHALRGFGNPQGHFALESMMDMLAEGIGMDPAEIRLRNAIRTGDTSVHGWVMRSCGLSECIEKATQTKSLKKGKASNHIKRGHGMGCAIHVAGMKVVGAPWTMASGAFVKINTDGTVNLLVGEVDTGQGSATILSQICAEELGVHMEDISTSPADTDFVPYGLGPVSSRTTAVAGNAVKLAAADAKRQLLEVAAEKLGINIKDLEARDRKIYVRNNPEIAMSIREAAAAVSHYPILGRATYVPEQEGSDPRTWYGDSASSYSFAAHIAEVEVDTETGEVKVLSFAAAHDLGKVINPLSAEGQIEGGIAQGLGLALTEELVRANSEVVNPQFSDYKIMTTLDMPVTRVILVETDEPRGPYGAKGVGEIVMVPTPAAIANAIYDAVGVRIKELPLTPEKILKALRAKSHP